MFDQVNHPPGLTWPNSQHLVCKFTCVRRMSSKDGLYPSMTSKDNLRRKHMDLEGYIILRGTYGSFDIFRWTFWSIDDPSTRNPYPSCMLTDVGIYIPCRFHFTVSSLAVVQVHCESICE